MDVSSFYSILNKTKGSYLDLNFGQGRIADLIIDSALIERHYTVVGKLTDKAFFRRASDVTNRVINLKLGSTDIVNLKEFNFKDYKHSRIVNIALSAPLLEEVLKQVQDGTYILLDSITAEVEEFLKVNFLTAEFVSEDNFYYIVKGNQSRKSVNTLASKLSSKVGRDISPNLT